MNLRNQIGLWEVLNPSIYLVSLAPLLAVLLQVGMADSALPALLLATAGVVALQHAVNIFNDLADDRRGADVEKHVSWVRFHRNRTRILLHAGLSVLCGIALGLAALWIADRIILLALAAPLWPTAPPSRRAHVQAFVPIKPKYSNLDHSVWQNAGIAVLTAIG